MESVSPMSRDSDTIVVDSGIHLATSISPATSISSKNVILDSEDASAPVVLTTNKHVLPHSFNKELLETPSSALEISYPGNLGGLESSRARDCLQGHHPRTVCRLLEDEESGETSAWEESSEGEASEEETSAQESFTEEQSDEESSDQAFLQEKITRRGILRTTSTKRGKRLHGNVPKGQEHASSFEYSQKLECVSVPPLLVPQSKYSGWKHTLRVCDERTALGRILHSKAEGDDRSLLFHDILLEDYVIYRPEGQTYYPDQVVTLDNIVSNREGCTYLLNGVLRSGEVVEYVEAMEIDIDAISIDGFEDTEIHSVHNMVYLKTFVCARRRHRALECWYRLGEPSEQYRDLHKKFLWVADLAKHVIDYLDWRHRLENDSSMTYLKDFKHDFLDRLNEWHGEDIGFQEWLRWYGKKDFRIPINRHREFIFSRAYNLGGHYLEHDLWSELMVRPVRLIADKKRPPEDTLVTPYVKYCCKSMPWSYTLQSERMCESVRKDWQRRATAMGFHLRTTDCCRLSMTGEIPKTAAALEKAAKSESHIAIKAQEALGSFAIIRTKHLEGGTHNRKISYAYIHRIATRQGRTEIKVLFVYLPSETTCLDGYYPHGDELFLSDNCNCSTDNLPIHLTDIVRLVGVTVGDLVVGSEDFFVRQKYVDDEGTICRLNESDFQCRCQRPYCPGDGEKELDRMPKVTLSGLGLFAGCGNFDIGLEAFGAVRFVAAVEVDETALKSYGANRRQGLDGLILDSVSPCLSEIFKGSAYLPGIGFIHFISAGSPCKGFSKINCRRGDDNGMRNCSLIASTLSYIETFLPSYAVLENVRAMGSGVGNSGNQAIACLVGLGYQVRKMTLNSRNFGSSQNRSRLFIVAAAPNVALPQEPTPSHTAATGFTKASAVSEGLPSVDNDDLICISHPDHIAGMKQTPMFRELIRRVPRYPKEMGFLKSIQERFQGKAQLEWFLERKSLHVKNHLAFTRLDPDGYIPTITTTPSATCNLGGGRIIHPDEHRTLTLLEARRAQGFSDEDVIIGDLRQQWTQVGNAVDRQVAIALGEVIANSWFSSTSFDQPEIAVNIPTMQDSSRYNQIERTCQRPPSEKDESAAYNSTGRTLLAEQIHKETEALIEEGPNLTDPRMERGGSEVRWESEANRDTISLLQDGMEAEPEEIVKSRTTSFDKESLFRSPRAETVEFLETKKVFKDESEFLKQILRPRTSDTLLNTGRDDYRTTYDPPSHGLHFSQIQRREMSTIELGPIGKKKSVRMFSERSIEVRTKTPSSSSEAFECGSRENPIDLETEVSVSKRRRENSSDDDDDDDDDEDSGLKNWVGKRVRSRLTNWDA